MQHTRELLHGLKREGLYRKLVGISSASGPRVKVEGREMLMLASNDYLGLSAHPRIRAQARQALEEWGAGSGASRLISGNLDLFAALEHRLADFKKTESALVFSTGYMANVGLLSALAGPDDLICSDELNHASIIDGCRLSRARIEIFPHRDVNALAKLLREAGRYRTRLIVTDGVFSMDGDLAPVPELISLAQDHGACLIIDDAHGTGVLGPQGRGTLDHFSVCGQPGIIIMGTMGKALGCFGAFVAGTADLRELLIQRARSFVFTTALPPAVAAAALEALQVIEDEPERRQRLHQNVMFLRRALQNIGYRIPEAETPIIPVLIGPAYRAVAVAEDLFKAGLFIQAIRPPTVPEGTSRLRITVMATHTKEDLTEALSILEQTGKRFGII